jgi:hypothetical protein
MTGLICTLGPASMHVLKGRSWPNKGTSQEVGALKDCVPSKVGWLDGSEDAKRSDQHKARQGKVVIVM